MWEFKWRIDLEITLLDNIIIIILLLLPSLMIDICECSVVLRCGAFCVAEWFIIYVSQGAPANSDSRKEQIWYYNLWVGVHCCYRVGWLLLSWKKSCCCSTASPHSPSLPLSLLPHWRQRRNGAHMLRRRKNDECVMYWRGGRIITRRRRQQVTNTTAAAEECQLRGGG